VGICIIIFVLKPSHHFLQTFRPLRMFTIVFGDSSLCPKKLPLFCLLRLTNANAERARYINNFCSMIKLLRELKNSSCQHRNIQSFDNVSGGKKENLKFAGLVYITKNPKVSCVLYAHSQFLCSLARFDLANRGVRQPVQLNTFCPSREDISAASFCSCKLL